MNGFIKNDGNVLVGQIIPQVTLVGTISNSGALIGTLHLPEGYEDYEGSYIITPGADSKTIATNDKHLSQDIVIEPIPYAEVSNDANGYTVTIG